MKKAIILVLAVVLVLSLKLEVRAQEIEEQIPLVDEFNYFTRCVQAEAGNQSLVGKRLVAAVILNRVEDERFPNSVKEVINQPHQFSVVSNGSINRVQVDKETIMACAMEMENRCNSEVLYFNCSPRVGGKEKFKYEDQWFGM